MVSVERKGFFLGTTDRKLTVFFDGACPLCDREISYYRQRPGAEQVCWLDVSAVSEEEIPAGLTRNEALARFHVLDQEGRLVSGGAAFATLWIELPGFRLLGRISRVPPIAWCLEQAYNAFLRFRPRLQNWLRARQNA